MKVKTTSGLVLALSLLLLAQYGWAGDKDKNPEGTIVVRGAIEDSQCAFNVHSEGRSHDWMIKKGVPGAKDERSCTQHCVKDMGGVYVLVTKDDIYRLDEQSMTEVYAGRKVKITAIPGVKPHTLHVVKIEEDK